MELSAGFTRESHPLRHQTMWHFTNPILLLIFLLVTSVGKADARPNIIVFYTDDHDHADLSCQRVLDDIRTPNIDALAKSGVLARNGYSTAPQCVPSRAGLLVGKYQSRFGVETNGNSLDGFDREQTIACKGPATLQRSLANGILGLRRRSPITVSGTFMHRTAEATLRRTSRWMAAIRRCRRSSQPGTTLMVAVEPAAFNRPAILLEAHKVTRFSGSSRSTPLRDST